MIILYWMQVRLTTMSSYMIKDNIKNVLDNIDKSLKNRDDKPCLIAVSKTKPVSMLLEAYEAGMRDFGENKVQEILAKYDKMPKDTRWHMIGHLQSNKVKYIIDKVCLIHSVDSEKLASVISKEAQKAGRVMPILIEVNIANEESKFGVSQEELPILIEKIKDLPGIRIEGLMCVAPYVDDPEENRQYFVILRQLLVDMISKNNDNILGKQLSMGMSGDYTVACEEGATYIRVGTSIFGERNYNQ